MVNDFLQEKYKSFSDCNNYIISYYLGLSNIVEKIDCDEFLFYPTYLLICSYYVVWLNMVNMYSDFNYLFKKEVYLDKICEYEFQMITFSDENKLRKCGFGKAELILVSKHFKKIQNLYKGFTQSKTLMKSNQNDCKVIELNLKKFKKHYNGFVDNSMSIYYCIVQNCLTTWYQEAKIIKNSKILEACNQDYIQYFGKPIERI